MAAVHRDGHMWSSSLTDGMANFDDQLNGEDDADLADACVST